MTRYSLRDVVYIIMSHFTGSNQLNIHTPSDISSSPFYMVMVNFKDQC